MYINSKACMCIEPPFVNVKQHHQFHFLSSLEKVPKVVKYSIISLPHTSLWCYKSEKLGELYFLGEGMIQLQWYYIQQMSGWVCGYNPYATQKVKEYILDKYIQGVYIHKVSCWA